LETFIFRPFILSLFFPSVPKWSLNFIQLNMKCMKKATIKCLFNIHSVVAKTKDLRARVDKKPHFITKATFMWRMILQDGYSWMDRMVSSHHHTKNKNKERWMNHWITELCRTELVRRRVCRMYTHNFHRKQIIAVIKSHKCSRFTILISHLFTLSHEMEFTFVVNPGKS
jgi:uncharacterized membrane-anchored protein YjiN (DUF445 family)